MKTFIADIINNFSKITDEKFLSLPLDQIYNELKDKDNHTLNELITTNPERVYELKLKSLLEEISKKGDLGVLENLEFFRECKEIMDKYTIDTEKYIELNHSCANPLVKLKFFEKNFSIVHSPLKKILIKFDDSDIHDKYAFKAEKTFERYVDDCLSCLKTTEKYLSEDNTELSILFKRLLRNSLLIKMCLFPLTTLIDQYKNNFDVEEKILIHLNTCIVLSRVDYFKDYFNDKMNYLISQLRGMEGCNVNILYIMGRLNFKRSDYESAKYFLRKAILYYEKYIPDYYMDDKYLQSKILFAYCYEYVHNFERAIYELIGMDSNEFVNLAVEKGVAADYDLFDKNEIDKKVEAMRVFYSECSNQFKGTFQEALKRDAKKINPATYGDKLEILHSLAHCCNEYAIKLQNENGDIEKIKSLIKIARATMLFVVNAGHKDSDEYYDFKTCLFMIYSECKDFDVSLTQINKDMNCDYYKNNPSFKAEVDFYKFLVSSFMLKTIDLDEQKTQETSAEKKQISEAYTRFRGFAIQNYDYDALVYIDIFYFKYKIANVVATCAIEDLVSSLEEIKNSKEFKKYRNLPPSCMVNDWVRCEYEKVIVSIELLINIYKENQNVCEAFTLASKYRQYYDYHVETNNEEEKSFLEQIEDDLNKRNITIQQGVNSYYDEYIIQYNDVLLEEINKESLLKRWYIFDTVCKLIEDYISPNSIFILAPLSSAVPYTYQTGNIESLVDNLYQEEEYDKEISLSLNHYLDFLEQKTKVDIDSQMWNIYREYENQVKVVIYSKGDYYYYIDSSHATFLKRPIIDKHCFDSIERIISGNKIDGEGIKYSRSQDHKSCRHRKCHTAHIYGSNKVLKDLLGNLFVSTNKINNDDIAIVHYSNNQIKLIVLEGKRKNALPEIQAKMCEVYKEKEIKKVENKEKDYFFISYSAINKVKVKKDLLALSDNNIRFWWDQHLQVGRTWEEQVLEWLDHEKCRRVVFYLSEDNLTDVSDNSGFYKEVKWVYDYNKKHANKIKIFPIYIGEYHNLETKAYSALSASNKNKDKYKILEEMFFNHHNHYFETINEDTIDINKFKKESAWSECWDEEEN